VAPRATAAPPVVTAAPSAAPVAHGPAARVRRAAPAKRARRQRAAHHRPAHHRPAHTATPAATATAAPSASSGGPVAPTIKPAGVVATRDGGGGRGRRVALAGFTLLALALTSAAFLRTTVLQDRRSPRT
jgi:cytoskeletal protein RodZ